MSTGDEDLRGTFAVGDTGAMLSLFKDQIEEFEDILLPGPLAKSIYTQDLEEIFKSILAGGSITNIAQDTSGSLTITVTTKEGAEKDYNLTKILKYAMLEHIEINEQFMKLYEKYVRERSKVKPELLIRGIIPTHDPTDEQFRTLDKGSLDVLTRAEKVAINIYTGPFHNIINPLLRTGSLDNPSSSDIQDALLHSIMAASGLNKSFDSNIKQGFDLYLLAVNTDPRIINPVDLEDYGVVPLIIKYAGEIWIFGKDAENKSKLTKSENPEHYENLFFPEDAPFMIDLETEHVDPTQYFDIYEDIANSDAHVYKTNVSQRYETFKGGNIIEERIKQARKGGVTREAGLTSTSAVKPAQDFGLGANSAIIFTDIIGQHVAAISQNPISEREILIPPIQIQWLAYKSSAGVEYFVGKPVRSLTGLSLEAQRMTRELTNLEIRALKIRLLQIKNIIFELGNDPVIKNLGLEGAKKIAELLTAVGKIIKDPNIKIDEKIKMIYSETQTTSLALKALSDPTTTKIDGLLTSLIQEAPKDNNNAEKIKEFIKKVYNLSKELCKQKSEPEVKNILKTLFFNIHHCVNDENLTLPKMKIEIKKFLATAVTTLLLHSDKQIEQVTFRYQTQMQQLESEPFHSRPATPSPRGEPPSPTQSGNPKRQ